MAQTSTIKMLHCDLLGVRGGVRLERGHWHNQDVFIKTLNIDDDEFQTRFHHEGQVMSHLAHPSLLPLLAHTQDQLVFPFVDGCSLRELLDQRPLSAAEAVSVTLAVLEATEYFHQQGVTHHDLKPENIMLLGNQANAQSVRVTDFGMAHDRTLPEDLHAGTRMGTPQFMSPEQFLGVRGDFRSDLYAVGGLLFDCLAGEPPHPDALGWLVGLSDERLPLPGPQPLHSVLEYALQRDPAKRPDTAAQMAQVLKCAWSNWQHQQQDLQPPQT